MTVTCQSPQEFPITISSQMGWRDCRRLVFHSLGLRTGILPGVGKLETQGVVGGIEWRKGRSTGNIVQMSAVVDHVFICTAAGAPAADHLRQFGLAEGSPNQHPGQGTACRRFFFRNAMLELLWVEDAAAARSEQTRRTRLWERCSETGTGPRLGRQSSVHFRRGSTGRSLCPTWRFTSPKKTG